MALIGEYIINIKKQNIQYIATNSEDTYSNKFNNCQNYINS